MLALTGTVGYAAPAAASSWSPCGANDRLVGVYAIPESGTRVGTLEVYWDAGAEQNCALAYGYGKYYGRESLKFVWIRDSNQGEPDLDSNHHYKYYAGPVRTMPGSTGCIDLEAHIAQGSISLTNVHCGS